MPGVRDKIIINGNGLKSFWLIFKGWFRGINKILHGSRKLAKEIDKNGWLDDPDVDLILKRQEESCARVDANSTTYLQSLFDFHSEQMSINEAMRRFIDKKRKNP